MAAVENHLIKLLPGKDRKSLLALCEPVELVLADVLYEPSKPMRHAYFPLDGFISLLTLTAGSPALEVGMVGREGMLGAQLAAASALQRSGLITYRRGELTVVDRRGLEAAACGCLIADRRAYAALMR